MYTTEGEIAKDTRPIAEASDERCVPKRVARPSSLRLAKAGGPLWPVLDSTKVTEGCPILTAKRLAFREGMRGSESRGGVRGEPGIPRPQDCREAFNDRQSEGHFSI